ncbi:MAG: hypothetical protein K9G49_16880 [Taibaiella sp.]|nr:hypothetical protein [Taibaiella sp.]
MLHRQHTLLLERLQLRAVLIKCSGIDKKCAVVAHFLFEAINTLKNEVSILIFTIFATNYPRTMKKIVVLVSVLAVTLAFTSCKKDYNCTCSYGNGPTASTHVTVLKNKKKKEALSSCKAKQGPSSVSGVTVTITCNLD